MGLKRFFKKAGGWIKDKFHKAKNAVVKVAKVAAPIAKKVVNFIDKTPFSGVVNTLTGGVFDGAKKVINMLPDGAVKKKAEEYAHKAEEIKNNVNTELDKRQEQAKGLIDKGRGLIDKGKQYYDAARAGGQASIDAMNKAKALAEQTRQRLQNARANIANNNM